MLVLHPLDYRRLLVAFTLNSSELALDVALSFLSQPLLVVVVWRRWRLDLWRCFRACTFVLVEFVCRCPS